MKTKYDFFIEKKKNLRKELEKNNNQLRLVLRKDIIDELLKRKFTLYISPYPPNVHDEFTYVFPNKKTQIDFTYVYHNHVHFMVSVNNKGVTTFQWYYERQKLTDFIDKLERECNKFVE